jgi:hypothetical protein
MKTEILNIPVVEKLRINQQTVSPDQTQTTSCCTPKNNAPTCCTPSRSAEENNGACCAQPEDGSECCNK